MNPIERILFDILVGLITISFLCIWIYLVVLVWTATIDHISEWKKNRSK